MSWKTIQTKLTSEINKHADEIVKLAQALVQIPTETHPPKGDEKPAQKFICEEFRKMGLRTDMFTPTEVSGITQHPGWWEGFDYKDRPNVVGVLEGKGGGKSLILNGHIDVVSTGAREKWSYEPFGGEIHEGRIYGRGSVDMKGPIAGMIMAVKFILNLDLRLRGNIIIESVVNEELGGFNGTLSCIARGYKADAAIIAEPTGMDIVTGTKGSAVYRVYIPGLGAHQGVWWKGVSAIEKAMKIKAALYSFQKERMKQTRDHPLYCNFEVPALSDDVYYFSAGDPNVMGVPTEAVMDFMVEMLPGEKREAVLNQFENYLLEQIHSDPFLRDNPPKLERRKLRPIYPTQINPKHPIVRSIRNSYNQVFNSSPSIRGFETSCDAMIFNFYSKIPCVIFGPGNLVNAHCPNEYLVIDDLLNFTKILALTIVDFCGYE